MKRFTLFLGLLVVPATSFALDFTDVSQTYTDAPFSLSEAAGISVLTNLTAVSGNPDGTFAAERPVNRAEFLKILFKSHPDIAVSDSDAADCFPDVKKTDWFSSYVCLAKIRKAVGGYPDGLFRPANTVNYAEALKMLSELYSSNPVLCLDDNPHGGCTQLKTYEDGAPWYQQYVDWAAHEGLLMPGNPAFAMPLTRGQVARLAASYRAWNDGELAAYRDFERGRTSSSSSSMMSASVSSSESSFSSSVVSLSSASSSSSVTSSSALFPAVSHFLLTGTRTPVVFDGTFTSTDEDGALRFVDVTLRKEVKSIANMTLVDASGKDIATLILATDNNTDRRKWRAAVPESSTFRLARGVPTVLGIQYNLFDRSSGGISNEFVDGIESMSMTISGVVSNASRQIVPADFHYPQHQTTDGRIKSLLNAGSGSAALSVGNNHLLGRFAIAGEVMTGGQLRMTGLEFTIASTNATVSNIRIGSEFPVQQKDCGIDTVQASHITCSIIPEEFAGIGNTGPTMLSVYGDVTLGAGATSGTLQMIFSLGRGKIGQNGALRWEDSSGHYNWVEASVPFENGTVWTVKP